MARPIRHVATDHYYLLTNRCLLGKYIMRPDEETRRIILGCLARAADLHDVQLVCFVFLSNHFHLIARFPQRNVAEFMEQLQGQLAERLNKHRGRHGTVFPERYHAQALLDEQVLRDKITYVLNNPVKDGLVARAGDWGEVSSMPLHESGCALEGEWLDYHRWRKLRRREQDYERSEAMREHTVELHVPEVLAGASRTERRESLLELVAQHRRRLHLEVGGNADEPPDVMGLEAVVERDWWENPDQPPSSGDARRLGVASRAEKMADYHAKRREIDEHYRRVSGRRPRPRRDAFPEGTYPPGCRHCVGSPAAA